MSILARPMFLLADSQLLFWREGDKPFLQRVRDAITVGPAEATAAYLGASNGDAPEFFELFRAAMESIGITRCMHVRAEVDADASAFLEEANVILLAGGDVQLGYLAFEKAGMVDRLRARSAAGAVLIGVSAGAVQIGTYAAAAADKPLRVLSLIPYAVGVHEEPDWEALGSVVKAGEGEVVGLGIPAGAGVVVHPDLSIEPVRKPLTEVSLRNGVLRVTEVLAGPAPIEGEPEPPRAPTSTLN